ncbi:MAG TPA: helix-turn-helix domain-containing protein [Terriglobia bacterium]|nr:helix-turn-helix domain-containing protein [Terriglobia bacterium]
MPKSRIPTPDDESLWTVEDVARYVRLTQSWVDDAARRRNKRSIPHIKLGRYARFEKTVVIEWAAQFRRYKTNSADPTSMGNRYANGPSVESPMTQSSLPTPDDESFWIVEDVARYLRVRLSWVYDATRRCSKRSIPHMKVGRYPRFDRKVVIEWAAQFRRDYPKTFSFSKTKVQ